MEQQINTSQKKEVIIFLILIIIAVVGIVFNFPDTQNLDDNNETTFFKSENSIKTISSDIAMNILPIKSEIRDTEALTSNEFYDLIQFEDLQKAFNNNNGQVRMVALLSASCGYCVKGFRYMRKILEEIPDERLKMYVVWEPMLSGDTRALSKKLASKGSDPRMVYQAWDANQISGKTYRDMMSVQRKDEWNLRNTVAWDVYFLYNGDAEWTTNEPTPPQYWQHQGAGTTNLTLSYPKLKAKVEEFLSELDN